MRISDWSSDVCSSDLLASSTQRPSRPFARLTSLPWLGGQRKRRHHAFAGFGVADRRLSFLLHFLPAHDALHRQVQGAGFAELVRQGPSRLIDPPAVAHAGTPPAKTGTRPG